jgi:hypothetical protein
LTDQFALVQTGFIGTLHLTINIRKSSSMSSVFIAVWTMLTWVMGCRSAETSLGFRDPIDSANDLWLKRSQPYEKLV